MVRKLSLLLGLVLLVSVGARAQDSDSNKVSLFAGYSYLRFDNSPSFNQNGWELSGEYKVMPWVGAVADFSGDYGSHTNTYYYLFGPQVSYPARVSPFFHVLFGGAHVSTPVTNDGINFFNATDTSFAVAVGGGIDAKITGPIHWRVFQGDYIHSSAFGPDQNNARISTGLVIKF